jgi:hypothetical protein
VISGARQVGGWSEYDAGKGIYRAAVPVGTRTSRLFVDGARVQRARSALNPSGFTLSGSSFVTADPSYASFTDQSQIQIVDDNDWKQMRCPLSSLTATASGGSSLNVNASCFADNNTNVPNVGFPFNGSGLPALDPTAALTTLSGKRPSTRSGRTRERLSTYSKVYVAGHAGGSEHRSIPAPGSPCRLGAARRGARSRVGADALPRATPGA